MTNEEIEIRRLLNDLALSEQEESKEIPRDKNGDWRNTDLRQKILNLASAEYSIGFSDCRKYVLERLKEIVGPKDDRK